MVDEYIWDRTGGVKRGIIIRGQVFCVPQIAPDLPDARLIQASAGVQHVLSGKLRVTYWLLTEEVRCK